LDIKGRETISCYYCGSTLRFRAIVDVLSLSLFGERLALPEFPVSKNVDCIGMSDSDNYAIPLSAKLNYTNTFYHKIPKLDIANIASDSVYCADVIISTDVFEHVPPPVQIAFDNIYKLLKNNGICIFSVPYKIHGDTDEHFKELFNYKILK
jgi:SAM-dependent methyltransferase